MPPPLNRCCVGLHNGKVLEFLIHDTIELRDASASLVNQIEHLEYKHDGTALLVAGTMGDGGIFNTDNWEPVWKLKSDAVKGVIYGACLSSDGKFVAIAHGSWLSVFDVKKDKRLFQQSLRGMRPTVVAISEDDNQVAVGTDTGTMWIWSLQASPVFHRSLAPAEESSLFGLSIIHPGSFVFRGQKTYRYDLDGDQLKVINENGPLDYSVSDAHGLVSVGDQVVFPTVIQKADRSVEISSHGLALNHFFETGTSVAGILVEADGCLRPYSAEPSFLPGSYESTTIHGNPISLVFSRDENTVCVFYNDGHLLAAQLNEKGITHAREILLPQQQAASLRLFACDADRVILDTGEGPRLLDLKSGNSIELKGRKLQSASLLQIKGSPFILGIDFNGTVGLWDEQANLISLSESTVTADGSESLLSYNQLSPGRTVLLSANDRRAFTTFGAQVFAWSLPDLDLLWRSTPLPCSGFSSRQMDLISFGRDASELVLTTSGLSEDVFEKIHVLQLPKVLPGVLETKVYLEQAYGLKVKDGKLISP